MEGRTRISWEPFVSRQEIHTGHAWQALMATLGTSKSIKKTPKYAN